MNTVYLSICSCNLQFLLSVSYSFPGTSLYHLRQVQSQVLFDVKVNDFVSSVSLSNSSLLVQRITNDLAVLPTFFFGPAARHVESQFPDKGSNSHPLQWKCRVLTTELPGKSRNLLFSSDRCFGVVLCGKLELRHLSFSSIWVIHSTQSMVSTNILFLQCLLIPCGLVQGNQHHYFH